MLQMVRSGRSATKLHGQVPSRRHLALLIQLCTPIFHSVVNPGEPQRSSDRIEQQGNSTTTRTTTMMVAGPTAIPRRRSSTRRGVDVSSRPPLARLPPPRPPRALPGLHDVAFNLGTSVVLVPTYMALLLRSPRRKRRRRPSVVDLVWSPSEEVRAPWRSEEPEDAPRWCLSSLVPAVLGAIFSCLLLASPGWSSLVQVARACWSARIPTLQALLREPAATALVWTQITFLDFLVARYVVRDSRASGNLPHRHTVALCFLVGPCGLVSHLVTKALVLGQRRRRRRRQAGGQPQRCGL